MATVDRAVPVTNLDRLCVDTIRGLAIDAVQSANSGHPGMPMAMAPVAYLSTPSRPGARIGAAASPPPPRPR